MTRGDAWLARKMLLETTAGQRAYDARSHGMKEPPGAVGGAISWGNGGFHGSADSALQIEREIREAWHEYDRLTEILSRADN